MARAMLIFLLRNLLSTIHNDEFVFEWEEGKERP
jgi:hypothetical protein